MAEEADATEITVVAAVLQDNEDVWVVRADGPDAESLACRLFDQCWEGEEGGSVLYNRVTLEGHASVRSKGHLSLDLRGMRTVDEVDDAIRKKFHTPAPGR